MNKSSVRCPKCGATVAYLIKVNGQMMCVDCAAERERSLDQLKQVQAKGR